MRTWLGPPFRGEGFIGNPTVRRWTDGAGGEHTERQLPEDVIPDVFFIGPTRRWRYDGQLEHARIWRHSSDCESGMEDRRFREHIWATARVLNGEAEAGVVADYPWMARCPSTSRSPLRGARSADRLGRSRR